MKRKLSDRTEYSNNEASTSVQGSSDNSTCGLLRRLQILSSHSSSNHEMSYEVENERGELPPITLQMEKSLGIGGTRAMRGLSLKIVGQIWMYPHHLNQAKVEVIVEYLIHPQVQWGT